MRIEQRCGSIDKIQFSRGQDFFADPDPITRELLKDKQVQLVYYHFYCNDRLAITPDQDKASLILYVLTGRLSFVSDGVETFLQCNDSVMLSNTKSSGLLTALEDSKCLGISTCHSQRVDSSNQLMAMVDKVEEKDVYTYGHSRRVCLYATAIALELDSSYDIISLGNAANLHDVGKINISAEILQKPGKLTPEEFCCIKQHPVDTYHLLAPLSENLARAAGQHHERMDGSGYPDGLRGDEICMDARIISIADVFDAITCKRTYNSPVSFEEAVAYLESCTTQYDQNIITALRKKVMDGSLKAEAIPFTAVPAETI